MSGQGTADSYSVAARLAQRTAATPEALGIHAPETTVVHAPVTVVSPVMPAPVAPHGMFAPAVEAPPAVAPDSPVFSPTAPPPVAPTVSAPAAPPSAPPVAAPPPPSPGISAAERQRLNALKGRVQRLLVEALTPDDSGGFTQGPDEVRRLVDRYVDQALSESGTVLPRAERGRLAEMVSAELLGFGPIQPLLDDGTISEVMVNGPHRVWVERKGKLEKTEVVFDDDAHVRRIIDRIVAPLGRRIDESSPMVDARLPDGSRVNAIIPPLALNGPTVTIRKFSKKPLTVQNLIEFGTLTPEAAEFLSAVVRGHTNVLVAGGTGSGKTTLLNILSSFIPGDERIVTIEDAAELRLGQEHVVSLEARPANAEGVGAVPIRQLLINALRMRPDRIVVGECRGGESLDMLQAMNTGHDGSMTTLHANTPRDALSRLETMVLMAGMDLPLRAIREQIASAVHLIVQQERIQDGSRHVTEIAEVQGMEGDVITLEPIFRYVQTGFDGRKVLGRLEALGPRPKLLQRLERAGITLPLSVFAPRVPAGI